MNENNDTQIVEYYLNNEDVYLNSKPYPRSDSYGRDGWFYMNTQAISGQTQADRICNVNIYNEESTSGAELKFQKERIKKAEDRIKAEKKLLGLAKTDAQKEAHTEKIDNARSTVK